MRERHLVFTSVVLTQVGHLGCRAQGRGGLGAMAEVRGSQNAEAELGGPGSFQKGVRALRASGEERASRCGADGLGGPPRVWIRHQMLRTRSSVCRRACECVPWARVELALLCF